MISTPATNGGGGDVGKGGFLPGEVPAREPEQGPAGPRTPYPVNDPGIDDQPGAEPDYLPGAPTSPGPRF